MFPALLLCVGDQTTRAPDFSATTPPNPDVCLQHANKAFSPPHLHPPLSPLTEFICISSATVTRRGGRLSSDPAAHKLFNHNCLHTVLHHTSRLPHLHPVAAASGGRGLLQIPLCDFTPGLQCLFFNLHNGALFSALPDAHRGDAGSPVGTPGWLPLTPPTHPHPPLPLCLYFTADRGSARAPPARVIYDRQLLGKSP